MASLLTLHLLGPFQAFYQDMPLTAFATDKVRALLIYLAMEPDVPHPRETLALLLYPEATPKQASDNLRLTLHRLRALLNQQESTLSHHLLTTNRTTIQLNAPGLTLDVATFRHAVVRVATKSQLTDADVETLTAAMALYRGEFAEGLSIANNDPFEEWLLLQRLAFQQHALQLCDALTLAYEQRGQFVVAQQYARQSLAIEPWREEAHRQLIRLLAANGQRSEALAQYERCRHLLEQEMGIVPSDSTQALVRDIQQGRFHSSAASKNATVRPRLHRFPPQFTSFVGREEALVRVPDYFATPEGRLVTLVGAGGIGKTSLSIQIARRLAQQESNDFRDGIYFVDCSPLLRVEDLASTIALVLGILLQPNKSAKEQVHTWLQGKSVCLVLDNVEQLLGCAIEVKGLLEASPTLKVLVTSREPLHLPTEWRYDMEGLSTIGGIQSQSGQLFIQRARQRLPSFAPNDAEGAAIQTIVEQVAGHPLAIELAATWVHFYSCQTIAEEIARGMTFLETTLRDVPSRHRSIRALFEHSWQLLTRSEQKMLCHLSILRGEWTLAQGTAVTNGSHRDLIKLLDKSLVRRTHAGRYAIHELIRQFALDRIQQEREWDSLRQRYALYFLQGLSHQKATLFGMTPDSAVASSRIDWLNIRYAWEIAIGFQAWDQLAQTLAAYQMIVEFTGLTSDGITDFEQLRVALPESTDTLLLRAIVQVQLAQWYFQRSNYAQSRDYATEVLSLEAPNLVRVQGQAWFVLAENDLVQGQETEKILACVDHAYRCFAQSEEDLGYALTLNLHATVLQRQAALGESLSLYTQALLLFENLGYPLGMMRTLTNIGSTYSRSADYEQALVYQLRALALTPSLNAPTDVARLHSALASSYLRVGEHDRTIVHYQHSLDLFGLMGDQRGVAIVKGNLGVFYHAMNRHAEALVCLKEAVEVAQRMGLKGVNANYLGCIGDVYLDLGQWREAQHVFIQCIELAITVDNPGIASIYKGGLGWAYFHQGECEKGFALLEEAIAEQTRSQLRDILAQTLYYQVEMLLIRAETHAAYQAIFKAIALRKEIGGSPTPLLKLEVLHARIQARFGETAAATDALLTLLEATPEPLLRAEVLFGLWEITGYHAYRNDALPLFASAYQQFGLYEYGTRLEALQNGK